MILRISLLNVIFNYLVVDFLMIKGSVAFKCYKCESSILNTDLNCQVEQHNKAYLKECLLGESTCVLVHYKGIDPKTGNQFNNIVRECSKSNSTGCTTKKRTSLTAKICFCKGDGCNKENNSRAIRASGFVQFALILVVLLFVHLIRI